jgi:hypothetical protein
VRGQGVRAGGPGAARDRLPAVHGDDVAERALLRTSAGEAPVDQRARSRLPEISRNETGMLPQNLNVLLSYQAAFFWAILLFNCAICSVEQAGLPHLGSGRFCTANLP